jgi:mannose-6-phosphate isomerase-like protein (cupin superfamily)
LSIPDPNSRNSEAAIEKLGIDDSFFGEILPRVMDGVFQARSETTPACRIGRMALFCAAVFSRDGTLRGGFLHRRGVHSNSPFNAPVLLTIKQAWQTMDCLRISSVDDLLVMNNKVSLSDKFSLFNDHWNPRIVGQLNGQHLKLVRFQGEFVWHHHEQEDEMFLVVKGRFRMDFRDHHEWIEEGEFIIVPRGVEHRPVADEEVQVMLFEPAGTLNTGNVQNQMTKYQPGKI